MTNLQKMIDCWQPIDDAHKLRIDRAIPNRIIAKREGEDEPYPEKILYKSSVDVGGIKPVSFPCWSDSETWKVIRPSQLPTHYMPLDTPERMAKVIDVLVGGLKSIAEEHLHVHGVEHELAEKILQQAERIAGG